MYNIVLYEPYKCICGYCTNKRNAIVAHKKYCKFYRAINCKIQKFIPFTKSNGDRVIWNKGLSKESSGIIKNSSIKISNTLKEKSKLGTNQLVNWNKNKPIQSYFNQSITRKYRYLIGELTPAKGVGRGKYSYIIHNGVKSLLRSTYEFIVAVYFTVNNYKFEVEAIRVLDDNNHVRISDFNIGNTIFEVKSIKEFIKKSTIKSFTDNGYIYKIIDSTIVSNYKSELETNYGFNMDKLIDKVIEGHNSRNYFIFNPLDSYQVSEFI